VCSRVDVQQGIDARARLRIDSSAQVRTCANAHLVREGGRR
jgi:hypothetical protein